MTTKDARTHHRQLRDLWEDEDPPSNWRPRISSTELQHLVSELFVFHRAAAVTLHRRDGDPVHLDIEHPYGVNAYGGLYRRLQQRMSERSGFTYAVRPSHTKRESVMRDLTHRTCPVTPAPYTLPSSYQGGIARTGLLWTYLDAAKERVVQARTYDPEALAMIGPYAGDMVVMNWGAGRLTTGAFPQCADCMLAGKFVVPRFYERSVPNWWLHVGAYCAAHAREQGYLPEVFHELRWSGADLVCPAWDDHASPLKR